MRTAWCATVLAVYAGAATVGGLEQVWAEQPGGRICACHCALPSPGPACRDCGCGARRNLCPACRARLAAGRAFQGPLIPLAAQVSDTPFPRFHPVPTRPVFLPLWLGPPAVQGLPEAPQPPLLKHLPPAALPEKSGAGLQTEPSGQDRRPPSQREPGPASRTGGDGWQPRSLAGVQTSWVFHPAVRAQVELEPRDASSGGRTARQPELAGTLR